MATQVIRYVDTDVVGGAGDGTSWANAYSALATAISTEAKDITAATGTDEQFTFICRASSGTPDTTVQHASYTIYLDGSVFKTAAANYVEIYAADFPVDGIWDATKYVLKRTSSSGWSGLFRVAMDFVKIHHLQCLCVGSGSAQLQGFWITSITAAAVLDFYKMYIKGEMTTSITRIGFNNAEEQDGTVVNLYNSIIEGWNGNGLTLGDGIRCTIQDSIGAFNVFNCVIFNCSEGVWGGNGEYNPLVIKNCAVGGNTTLDFGTDASYYTVDYCCTDDIPYVGHRQGPLGGDWDNEFVDKDNGDFTLKVGGNCIENGIDNPGSGLYSDDITGKERS
jgi:hypothetical protein